MTVATVDRLYLVCTCGSRFLLGRRDDDAWKPAAFDEQRAAPWFERHSRCLDRAAAEATHA
jgi:hypothetical protein